MVHHLSQTLADSLLVFTCRYAIVPVQAYLLRFSAPPPLLAIALRHLEQSGALLPVSAGPAAFAVRREGLERAGLPFAPAKTPSPLMRHFCAVAWAGAWLERTAAGRWTVLCEREIRAGAFGRPLADPGGGGGRIPDLLLRRGERFLGVEVELSLKGRRRLAAALDAWSCRSGGAPLLYLVPPRLAGALERSLPPYPPGLTVLSLPPLAAFSTVGGEREGGNCKGLRRQR